MIALAQDAAKARLNASRALREACEGRFFTATTLRMAYNMDAFSALPADMAGLAKDLDGGST